MMMARRRRWSSIPRTSPRFLMWAAEPHMEDSQAAGGCRCFAFLIIFTVLMYFTKKKVWADAH